MAKNNIAHARLSVIDLAGGAQPVSPEFLEAYAEALARFKDRLWPEAIAGFQRALSLKP